MNHFEFSRSSTPGDISPAQASVAIDSNEIREHLGRMMRRTMPVSEMELFEATHTLNSILNASDAAAWIENHRWNFPKTLLPLLVFHLGQARLEHNDSLEEVLELVLGHLTITGTSIAHFSDN